MAVAPGTWCVGSLEGVEEATEQGRGGVEWHVYCPTPYFLKRWGQSEEPGLLCVWSAFLYTELNGRVHCIIWKSLRYYRSLFRIHHDPSANGIREQGKNSMLHAIKLQLSLCQSRIFCGWWFFFVEISSARNDCRHSVFPWQDRSSIVGDFAAKCSLQ